MAKKNAAGTGCRSTKPEMGCCKVEAVIAVDERGQTVLPKDVRERAGIKAGDKLAVVSWFKDGEVCCLGLVKIELLTEMVKNIPGPVMKEVTER